MKITKRQLKRIIREERIRLLNETNSDWDDPPLVSPATERMPDLDWPAGDQVDYDLGFRAGLKAVGVPEEYYSNLDFLTGYIQGLENREAR